MASAPNPKNRVIIIDDNPAIHEDFRKILVTNDSDKELREAEAAFLGKSFVEEADNSLSIDLDSAMQGEEGYRKVQDAVQQKRPYALAFVDMRMPPGWDGLTTIKKLWEADPDLQVVICSAYSDNTWADIRRQLGRSDRLLILKKPFDNSEVLQMTAALIEKRRLKDIALNSCFVAGKTLSDTIKQLFNAQSDSERILMASESIMIKVDANGVIQRWNPAATIAFGLPKSKAIGHQFNELNIEWVNAELTSQFFAPSSINGEPSIRTSFRDKQGLEREVRLTRYQEFNGELTDDLIISGALIIKNTNPENNSVNLQQSSQA